jgi:hypothetical protein
MSWVWRGDFTPASFSEYDAIKKQLSYERVGDKAFTGTVRATRFCPVDLNEKYAELSESQQTDEIKARLKAYTAKVYKKTKITQGRHLSVQTFEELHVLLAQTYDVRCLQRKNGSIQCACERIPFMSILCELSEIGEPCIQISLNTFI